jgi:2-polyprenyl-3-methyl-5-hydroxy-6-metoxy-1,4-benzoquinol methylase
LKDIMGKKCYLCNSLRNKVVFREFNIDILQCLNCGHIFSSYGHNQDYDGYFGYEEIGSSGNFYWDEAHKKMYDDFFHRFISNKNGKLLDVGCGQGFFLKKFSGFPQWQVFGFEISQVAVDFARNKLGLKNIFCGRVEGSNFEKRSFDIITLWDVIEHIPNPDQLLLYLNSLLKKNGILFMHTPNVQVMLPIAKMTKALFGMDPKFHYLEARDHINQYSAKTISLLLKRNGFNDVSFIHLYPIQSVVGGKSQFLRFLKNSFFKLSQFICMISFGRINFDNLFIVAKKP